MMLAVNSLFGSSLQTHTIHFSEIHSCKDYLAKGINVTGNYYLNTSANVIKDVFCDFASMDFHTCHDYYEAGYNTSGEYNVFLDGHTFTVDCDFSTGVYGFLI